MSTNWVSDIKEKAVAAGYVDTANENELVTIERDHELIYECFKHMGVDLEKEDISFSVFLALLKHAPKECRLTRVAYLRMQEQDGNLTRAERKEFAALNAGIAKR